MVMSHWRTLLSLLVSQTRNTVVSGDCVVVIDFTDLFRDAESKYVHALRRRQLVAALIRELDRLFFELLGLRESVLIRGTVWSNRLRRWRMREIESTGGRRRPRS
jgi:hypothetical protein